MLFETQRLYFCLLYTTVGTEEIPLLKVGHLDVAAISVVIIIVIHILFVL